MPRWKLIIALAAGASLFALAVSLGNWQTRRGDTKAAAQAQWDAAERAEPTAVVGAADVQRVAQRLPQRVRVHGVFESRGTIYLDNRIVDGVAGFMVVTPLVLGDGGPWVLVNRGWKARGMADRNAFSVAPPPAGPIVIEGLAVERAPRLMQHGTPSLQLGGFWQNLDYAEYQKASGRQVAHLVVQQTSAADDGLRRLWPRPDTGIAKHRGYAFQWYALAVLIAVLMAVFGTRAWRATR